MFELFNEDQEMLKKVAREFAEQEIAPHAAEWDEQDKCPTELWPTLGEMGFFGLFVPEDKGGPGLGITERAIVLEEIARYSAGLAIAMMTHDLAIACLLNFGSEEQQKEYLPILMSGQKIGGLSVTEPTGGSDLINHNTMAEKTEDGQWVINGRKVFITNSAVAQINIITACTGVNEKGRKQLSAFIVPEGTPGWSAGRKENKLGLRGSVTGEVIANDVKVPANCLIGKEGKGAGAALHTIGHYGRTAMSAIALGGLRGSLEEGIKFAKERIIYGKPLARVPAIADALAENKIDYSAGSALLYSTTTYMDMNRKENCIPRVAACKYFTTEAAIRGARRTMDLMGGYGVINEYPVGRFLRDSLANIPSGAGSQIQKLIVAGDILA